MSVFTDIPEEHWRSHNDLAFAIRDRYPVSPGHTLVITKREVPTWFDATPAEQAAVMALVEEVKCQLDEEFKPDGYNVGFNAGAAAGQTVPHLHVHVIPRYAGDMDDPRGGVRYAIPSKGNYLAERGKPLATGGDADPFLRHLSPRMATASAIDILAAFVQESGVQRLLPHFRSALARGAHIRVLTGDYLDLTQAEGLALLMDLAGFGTEVQTEELSPTQMRDEAPTYGRPWDEEALARSTGLLELRVVEVETLALRSFHPKSWRFEAPGYGVAWVGSSNLSATALGAGVEWNLRVDRDRDTHAYRRICDSFDALWRIAREPDYAWLAEYEARAAREPQPIPRWEQSEPPRPRLEPHKVQREALAALANTRAEGRTRALVVLATGLGKTLLAAFDYARLVHESGRPLRLLFVAHRRELLRQAAGAFRAVLAQDDHFPRIGLCVDDRNEMDADLVFASVAKLSQPRQREVLRTASFDHVVFDEVHHATAPSWRRVLAALNPGFLLGLTATPDRADNADVLGLFDDHLAFEAGIPRGIEVERLVPFHYYGVRDTIDFTNIPWRNRRWDPEALSKAAATEARMQTMWRAWQAHPGTRTLVFCCSVAHANFVKDWLKDHGVSTRAVYTGDGSDDRDTALAELDAGTLDALCAVDLFNEGVDVPALDRVVMLRPTESTLLFLQQLGRGLRVHPAKERLTVLDFVGNHKVFARRLETLLRAGGERAARLIELLGSDEALVLPAGCLVELELEAKQLLREIAGRRSAVEEVYRELRAQNGERPSAGVLQRMGYRPGTLRGRHGSWFEFVAAEGDLTAAEAAALPILRSFLKGVETTQMVKSFKAVTLAVLSASEDPFAGLPPDELAIRCRELLERRPELWDDVLPAERGDLTNNTARKRWLSYWRRNPIAALTEGDTPPLCRLEHERLVLNCPRAPVEATKAMLAELADWRINAYLDRTPANTSQTSFRCRLIQAKGRPIAKLPDRSRYQVPEGEVTVRLPDGRLWVFRFAKEFINVAHPVEEDGNQFGALMREWFGERAGARGTGFEVEFRVEEAGWRVAPASGTED